MDEARLKVTDRLIGEATRTITRLETICAKWAAKLADARQRRDSLIRERIEQTKGLLSEPQTAGEVEDRLP